MQEAPTKSNLAKTEPTAIGFMDEGTIGDEVAVIVRSRQKWGVAAEAGFQIIPDVLFRCQRFLDLDATDVVILSNITLHWWYGAELPHPRPSAIAQRMNVSTRTVERRIGRMEKKGLIKRLPSRDKEGKTVREFDLSGLVERLGQFGEEYLDRYVRPKYAKRVRVQGA